MAGAAASDTPSGGHFEAAQRVGRMEDPRLVECSGLDASTVRDDLLWAVNDSGNEPYLHALGIDGRSRGRVRVAGAQNRDWEDLATFTWKGCPMILIADVGDNHARRALVLTYKNAYLFERRKGASWKDAFGAVPVTIPLPLPEWTGDLQQREAACFSADDSAVVVTSEGKGAGIYRLKPAQ